MAQPLLAGQSSGLNFFQFNNEERTTINLSGYTLFRADKVGMGYSCLVSCFAHCCNAERAGRIRLHLKEIGGKRVIVTHIAYDKEAALATDLDRVLAAFRSAAGH